MRSSCLTDLISERSRSGSSDCRLTKGSWDVEVDDVITLRCDIVEDWVCPGRDSSLYSP